MTDTVNPAPSSSHVRYPTDRVLAVLDTRSELERATGALTTQGFLESELEVFGPEAAEQVHNSTGHAGVTDLIIRIAEWTGLSDEESEVKGRYAEELRDGHFVVGVLAPNNERKQVAAKILQQSGGHFVHYFSRFKIELLHR